MIRISEIMFRPMASNSTGLIGLVSFEVNNEFKVNGVGVFDAPAGDYRLAYPTYRHEDGRTETAFHPLYQDVDKLIAKVVTEKINEVYKEQDNKIQDGAYYEPYLEG